MRYVTTSWPRLLQRYSRCGCSTNPRSTTADLTCKSVTSSRSLAQIRTPVTKREAKNGWSDTSRSKTTKSTSGPLKVLRALRCREQTADRTSQRTCHSAELRAMTSAGGRGGSFVTPAYLHRPSWRLPRFPSVILCTASDLAGPWLWTYGISLPAWTSVNREVREQIAENWGITTSSPTGAYVNAPFVTQAGEVTASQQFVDRAGPTSAEDQLRNALENSLLRNVDCYPVTQAIAAATSLTGAASFSAADFWQDLGQLKAALETGAGSQALCTHLSFPTSTGGMATHSVATRPDARSCCPPMTVRFTRSAILSGATQAPRHSVHPSSPTGISRRCQAMRSSSPLLAVNCSWCSLSLCIG